MNDSTGGMAGQGSAAGDRFIALFSHAPFGIAITDTDGTIVESNPALSAMLGEEPDALRGKHIAGIAGTAADGETLRAAVTSPPAEDGDDKHTTVVVEHRVDGPVHANVTVTRVVSDRPGVSYPLVMFEDVSDLHLLHETLRRQTVHDQLTGLPNATSFRARLESAMADRSGANIALIFFDIDGFRIINDGLGADAGDRILREAAGKLQAAFAAREAIVARLTGDGFGVLLHGSFTTASVVTQVENALEELAEPVYLDDTGIGISASAGIVVGVVGDGAAEDLVRAAEITLHRAKEAGKAQWVLFDSESDRSERHRYRRAASIAGALETGQLELVYHPTVRPDGSDRIVLVHTDLRWNHPEDGPLCGEEFLPLADATGMSLHIGKWMVGDALATAAKWRSEVGEDAPNLSVRLPARLAIDHDLVGIVRSGLEANDLPAGMLCIATSAATALDPRGEVSESLSLLAEIGVQIAAVVSSGGDIDAVFAGSLPVCHLVLTGPLIDALDDQATRDDAVRHLTELIARPMERGVLIAAQGLRTREQARILGDLGVVAVRGDFLHGSLTCGQVRELLGQRDESVTGG